MEEEDDGLRLIEPDMRNVSRADALVERKILAEAQKKEHELKVAEEVERRMWRAAWVRLGLGIIVVIASIRVCLGPEWLERIWEWLVR